HEAAIHWLNEMLPADTAFYLLKLEAYRIGDSLPAPLLTVVAGPSPESKEIGAQKKELAERNKLYLKFWEQLLERAKGRTSLHAQVSPSKGYWLSTGAGIGGVEFIYVVLAHEARVELYIDTGEAEKNKRIFDALFAHKEQIEETFGAPLRWDRLDERRASAVRYDLPDGGVRDQERWPEIQERLIETMIRFERALRPEIERARTVL
ncbi:MAG: DUF4268 domain-containing protein, partial [Anaerolineae bacterium]|nr:DUF4268 domain-containing protein [Anaerolineae bacterium]